MISKKKIGQNFRKPPIKKAKVTKFHGEVSFPEPELQKISLVSEKFFNNY